MQYEKGAGYGEDILYPHPGFVEAVARAPHELRSAIVLLRCTLVPCPERRIRRSQWERRDIRPREPLNKALVLKLRMSNREQFK